MERVRPFARFAAAALALSATATAAAPAVTQDPPAAPPMGSATRPAAADEGRQLEIDRAVARGLAFLARGETEAGGWTGDVGHKQGDGYLLLDTAARQEAAGDAHLGVSAICGLAFLADGHVPARGAYAPVLERTIDLMLRNQGEFGYIAQGETRMYSHAFATLFLAQVRGMEHARAEQVDEALRRAVAFLESTQNERGGWRYTPFTVECDLSVTVCQVQALRAARNAGIHVGASCIDRVIDYMRASRIPSGDWRGAFYYKIHGRAARTKTSFAINAAAVTCLHSAGLYDESEYGAALTFVAEQYPALSAAYPHHFYYWYGNYYAAQALHAEGGRRWERYWPQLRDDLLRRQQADGRWVNDVGPGDAFATAMACLLLRVPAQYLPIFQR